MRYVRRPAGGKHRQRGDHHGGAVPRSRGHRATVVATDFSSRPPQALDVIGVFVNELPVFADLSAALTFREAAGRVGASLREVSEHRCVPLGDALGSEAARQRIPGSVSYRRRQASPSGESSLAGLRLTADWTMFAPIVRAEVHLQLVDSGAQIAEFASAAIAGPDLRVGELSLLPSRERRQFLADWNQTRSGFSDGTTLGALLDQQAARTPGATAVGLRASRAVLRGAAPQGKRGGGPAARGRC